MPCQISLMCNVTILVCYFLWLRFLFYLIITYFLPNISDIVLIFIWPWDNETLEVNEGFKLSNGTKTLQLVIETLQCISELYTGANQD